MWNKSKSILLSKTCIFIFTVLGIALCVALPWLANWLIDYSGAQLNGKYFYLLITGYLLAVPAFIVLYKLYSLLRNISEDLVFIDDNIVHLRSISWLCILAGAICMVSAIIYYPAAAVIGAVASFMGLIIRVLKMYLHRLFA